MSKFISLAVVVVVLTAGTSHAQIGDAALFVRDLYLRYAQVEPTREMVAAWVNALQKGTPVNEVHANILGSAQTFDRVGRNETVWLGLLYGELLNREPDQAGLAHWQRRLRDLRRDRVRLAREFLVSAGAEINTGAGQRPDFRPEDLPKLLHTSANLLCESCRSEFPGLQHMVVQQQAHGFEHFIEVQSRSLAIPIRNPQLYAEQVRNLDNGLRALEAAVAQCRIQAPTTRQQLAQCRLYVNEYMRLGNIAPGLEAPAFGGGLSREEARRFRDLFTDLSRSANRAEATFHSVIPQSWATTPLLRQVDVFESEVESLRNDIRSGTPRQELARRCQLLVRDGQAITAKVAELRVDPRASQAWVVVCQSFNPIDDALKSLGGVAAPLAIVPIPAGCDVLVDRALAECDDLAAAYSPYAYHNRAVPKMLTDVQDLRNRYRTLRLWTANPEPNQLRGQLDSIDERLRSLQLNHAAAMQDRRLAGAPNLEALVVTDQQIDRALRKLR